ncbi:MAG: DNA primase [Pseudomonadota bacterium]
MVPSEVIDEIRSRVDLVRIIGEVVPLKKSGRNFAGLCPFHHEKSPSFTVSETKQLFHCFGCGEGGTVFNFIMKYHRLTFPEALERLAALAGVDLAQYQKEAKEIEARKEEKKKIFKILAYARDRYHQAFMESDVAKGARAYAEKRGLSMECAKRLKIGYAPEGWDTLVRAIERDGQPLADAVRAGLIGRKRDGGHYDLFRSRLLFPIQDPDGETVGFGGRILGDGSPKYLNTPQTPVFDKGRLLFGLHEADETIRREKTILVVEGYLDQVTLFEAGIRNTVATSGTALTETHAKLLKKYADEVVVIFDGDTAGRTASRRSMRPLLSEGLRARAALLPDGFDPDTFVQQKGKEAFVKLVTEAEAILPFVVREFYRNESDVTKKAVTIEELVELVKGTSNLYLREAILEEASKLTGLEKTVLRGEKPARAFVSLRSVPAAGPPARAADKIPPEELALLRLAAEVPQIRERLANGEVLSLFSSEQTATAAKGWLEKIEVLSSEDSSASSFVDAWYDEGSRPLLTKVFMDPVTDYAGAWEQIWDDCLKKLRGREISRLTKAVASAETAGDLEGVRALSVRVQELKRKDLREQGRRA